MPPSPLSRRNFLSAVRSFEVTPSDSTELPWNKGLWVGASGTLVLELWDDGGNTASYGTVPTGTLLPFSVRRVLETGTTATALVAVR